MMLRSIPQKTSAVATELWLWVCCHSNRILSSNMLSASHQPRTRSRRKQLASWWEQPRESEHKLSLSFAHTHTGDFLSTVWNSFYLTLREKNPHRCFSPLYKCNQHTWKQSIRERFWRGVSEGFQGHILSWKGDGRMLNHLKSHPKKHSLKGIL